MGSFLKRHVLWGGFLAALVPLLALLVLQYRWLVDLEEKSAIAHKATLNTYLEAIAIEVEYFYRGVAESLLEIPSSVFTGNHLDDVADHFAKKGAKGVKRLFVLSFVKDDRGKLLFYDPTIPSMEPSGYLSEARAAYVATAAWQVLSDKEIVPDPVGLSADEKDRENRIIINPIIDNEKHLVGIAGMVVDEDFFRQVILPEAISRAGPVFLPGADHADLDMAVLDGKGEPVIGSGTEGAPGSSVKRHLQFIFADYQLALSVRPLNMRAWAQASFLLNMTLAVIVALVLLLGIGLALRAASREMTLSGMKSDFVSNVSHELRTPLASIRVFAELLRTGKAGTADKVQEYGEYIEGESQRLTALVDNILDFAKIESGRKTYRFETADINDVVRETLKTFDGRLRHSESRVMLQGPQQALPPIRVDADAIAQALSNLLDNAFKYGNGAQRIEVRLSRREKWIEISVKDQGVGIAREEQDKIFERFHRVGTGLIHGVKGSGLGLSIVQHIVEAHHGRVAVESKPGTGSTFTISLPIAEGAPDAC